MKIIVLTYAKDYFGVASIDRLVEEATLRGHTIERVRYSECSLTIEGGVPKIYYRGNELTDLDAVIPWIIQGGFNYGMDVLRHFRSMGIFVLNDAEAFENACHKWRAAQLMVVHDIPTPNTYRSYEYNSMNEHIDNMLNGESVIKIATGTRGNGVILASDRATAKSIVGTLGITRADYIIQEYIRESYGVDVRAYVVGGKVVAAMERRASEGFRSNLSLGGKGQGVTLSMEDTALVVKAAQALGLNSAGVDFIQSNRGSLILEANASGEFGIERVTGINVASRIIEYVESNAKRRHKKDKIGA